MIRTPESYDVIVSKEIPVSDLDEFEDELADAEFHPFHSVVNQGESGCTVAIGLMDDVDDGVLDVCF